MNKIVKKIAVCFLAMLFSMPLSAFAKSEFTDTSQIKERNDIILLNNLGIIQGYDDNTFRPDNSVSRIEFAVMLLRFMGLENIAAAYEKGQAFGDIPENHWAYTYAGTIKSYDIAQGIGEGLFDVNGKITYQDALKMVVSALNYDSIAQIHGGYPEGYITVATDYQITKGISNAKFEEPITRAVAARILANSLEIENGDIYYQTSEGVVQKIEKGDTALDILGFEVREGTVTSTYYAQEKEKLGVDDIIIDNVRYKMNTEKCIIDVDSLFGRKIKYYYNTDEESIHHIELKGSGAYEQITAMAEDISSNTTLSNFIYADGKRDRTEKLDGMLNVYYNGRQLESIYINDDILKPDEGKVVISDLDDNGVFETAFVTEYETYVVKKIADKKIYDRYNQVFDYSDIKNIRVYDGSEEVGIDGISAGDVISVLTDKNNIICDIFISRNQYSGTIKTIDNTDNALTIKLSDGSEVETKYAANFLKALKNSSVMSIVKPEFGKAMTFYTNINGKIAYTEEYTYVSDDGAAIKDRERKYGFLWRVITAEEGENVVVLYTLTEQNRYERLKITTDSDFKFGRPENGKYTVSRENINNVSYSTLSAALSGIKKILISYVLNDKGDIVELYMPDTTGKSEEYLSLAHGRAELQYGNGCFDNKYYVDYDTVVFNLPENMGYEKYNSVGKYNDFFSNGQHYVEMYDVDRDGRVGAVLYTGKTLITYSSKRGGGEIYLTPGSSPVMYVEKISQKADENEEVRTVVCGYVNGKYTEEYLSDTLLADSEDRSLIRPGAVIQYVTDGVQTDRAYYAENPEQIVLFRRMLNLAEENTYHTYYSYSDEYVKRSTGLSDTTNLIFSYAKVKAISDNAVKIQSNKGITLQKQTETSVMSYNTATEKFTQRSWDDLEIDKDVFVRQRVYNTLEVVYIE